MITSHFARWMGCVRSHLLPPSPGAGTLLLSEWTILEFRLPNRPRKIKARPRVECLSDRVLPGDTCGGYFLSAFGVLPFVDPIHVVNSLASEPGQDGSSNAAWPATSSLTDATAILATVADVTPSSFLDGPISAADADPAAAMWRPSPSAS